MHRHALQPCLRAHALQYLRETDKVPVPPRCREYPRATLADRLALDQSHGCGTNRPELCAALGILEADTAGPAVNPRVREGKCLHAAQPSQQEQADSCE